MIGNGIYHSSPDALTPEVWQYRYSREVQYLAAVLGMFAICMWNHCDERYWLISQHPYVSAVCGPGHFWEMKMRFEYFPGVFAAFSQLYLLSR